MFTMAQPPKKKPNSVPRINKVTLQKSDLFRETSMLTSVAAPSPNATTPMVAAST